MISARECDYIISRNRIEWTPHVQHIMYRKECVVMEFHVSSKTSAQDSAYKATACKGILVLRRRNYTFPFGQKIKRETIDIGSEIDIIDPALGAL